MLKNEVLNIDGRNWLVREAVSEEAARNTIAHARVTGSIGGKDTVRHGGEGPATVTADVVRLNDDGTECLPYGEKGGTDHSELVALAAAKKLMGDTDPHRAAACLIACEGIETPALVELIDLGGVPSLAKTITRQMADYAQLGRTLNQSNLRNRAYAGALASIDALVTGELPIHHDATFLRAEIAKVITEAHATIADDRAAAMLASALPQ